jgi:hypothetical protein
VKVGKSSFCTTASLPATGTNSPLAIEAGHALALQLDKVRDRHKRHTLSLSKLLRRIDPNASSQLQQAVATDIGRTQALGLALGIAPLAHTASAHGQPLAVAAASGKCQGVTEYERLRKEFEEAPPDEKAKAQKVLEDTEKGLGFKDGDFETHLGLNQGMAELGIDARRTASPSP